MTTINTIEDLIRVLDDNPEWLEALRARLLTRELLEMPNTLARFMETTNQRFEEIDRRFEKVDQRFDGVESEIGSLQSDVRDLQSDVKGLQSDVKGLQSDVGSLQSNVQGLRDDVGVLKGAHARSTALRRFRLIADDMGLHDARLLPDEDIWNIAQGMRRSGAISRSEYESFHDADMIVEALDSQDKTCYIAVEISYTANGRDSTRAIRNARFLTQHTGQSAYAAVASVEADHEIQDLIDSGKLHLHRIPRHLLEAN